uniref:ADP,ATP carrier protein n=2 Tax=Spongospora subterranea TaxID=70186 RepID=A0A0H5R5P4_9EUKA|eukprot:CRZ09102.1 hypothetical protein [Spongospora subterranea]
MGSSLWPVERYENKKVIPMIMMSFLICFNYTLLRDLKDVLVLGEMPTAVVPWLKFGLVLPSSVVVMLIYTKMSLRMSKEAIFYTFMSSFLAFFALYGLVLNPLRHYIEPGASWTQKYTPVTADEINRALLNNKRIVGNMYSSFPKPLVPLMYMTAHWSTTLLYVMSELWGTVCISLLFWGYANDICVTSEAKRFYTLFNIGANFSLIFCGSTLIYLGWAMDKDVANTPSAAGNDKTISILMALVVLFGLITMGIYRYMQTRVLTDPRLRPAESSGPKKAKVKMSFVDSLKTVFFNSYVLLIGVMVIVYGLAINFVEIYYKDCWSRLFTAKSHKYMFQGLFSIVNGTIALFLLICIGGKAIRTIGWTKTALITPITIISTGLPFMILYVVDKYSTAFPLAILVWLGFITVALSKAVKYSFFDPTKEMSFIPLGEARGRAKGAVDVVGARFGKSASSVLQIFLQTAFTTFQVSAYVEVLVVLLVVAVGVWTLGTVNLGKKYTALTTEKTGDLELNATVTKA